MFRRPTRSTLSRAGTRPGGPWRLLATAAIIGAAAGCQQPLLAPDDPRTQYDNYDQVRNEHPPAYLIDEYGRERPNLRGRLLRR